MRWGSSAKAPTARATSPEATTGPLADRLRKTEPAARSRPHRREDRARRQSRRLLHLVAAQVQYEQATSTVRQGLSRHFPIPVALIARLAVTAQHHGAGLGRSLLLDALQRVVCACDQLAVGAVTVDSLDDRAASFYSHFGFEHSPLAPSTLMISLDVLRRTLPNPPAPH
ncbi:MAG TPA: GNAT family N-acetyltransferase [Solirubrobacteraceae bacterium]